MPAHRNGFPGGWRRQCPSPGDGGDPSPGLRLAGRVPGLGAQAGAELPVGGGQAKEVPCCRLAGAAAAEPPGGGAGLRRGRRRGGLRLPQEAGPATPARLPALTAATWPRDSGPGARSRSPAAAAGLGRSPLSGSTPQLRPPPASAFFGLPMPPDFARLRLHDGRAPDPNGGAQGHPDGPAPPTTPTSNRTTPTHKHTVAHSREHPLRNRQVDTDSLKENETERKVERGRPEREKVRESESQSARALEKEHSAMELGLARNRVAGPGCGRTNGALRRVFPWLGWLL
ncbi:hypothetical protein P7K49_035531 [Saguinus oedipus]|uniref:Uncharacterized protein n=1 Tax=Saguinus oedipus TaxID=9490 RepID=A0ABQ9TN67_SAGOE|nr:hypothetical protein P7K49_035531 [Saguinus oedipus]